MGTTELTELLKRVMAKHHLTPRQIYQAMIPIINEGRGKGSSPARSSNVGATAFDECTS